MTEIPKEKFLFVIPVTKVAKKCCFCTLRLGVLILAIISLVINIILMINYLEHLYSHWIYYRIAVDSIRLVGSVLLLYSLKTEKYRFAIISYYIYTVNMLLHIVLTVSFIIKVGFIHTPDNFTPMRVIAFCAIATSIIAIETWLIWIMFSYAKLLKYRQTEVIKGKPDVDYSYKNVSNELTGII
jgi:hypothetical protein